MKLHNVEKITKGDHITFKGQWRNQMRTPARVNIEISKNTGDPDPTVFLQGRAYDVGHTLNAIAELAWNEGWRPAGLLEAMAGTISKHKI